VTARFGCPVGGLCQELGKQGGPLADLAAKLLHDVLNWTETQFVALDLESKAADYALHLLSSVQGMFLLTHTFKDPQLAIRKTQALQEWLEALVQRKPEPLPVPEQETEVAFAE